MFPVAGFIADRLSVCAPLPTPLLKHTVMPALLVLLIATEGTSQSGVKLLFAPSDAVCWALRKINATVKKGGGRGGGALSFLFFSLGAKIAGTARLAQVNGQRGFRRNRISIKRIKYRRPTEFYRRPVQISNSCLLISATHTNVLKLFYSVFP